MDEKRIIELEIKLSYQDDLLQALNQVVAQQQNQLSKLEETCKLLHDKLKSLQQAEHKPAISDERPPHY